MNPQIPQVILQGCWESLSQDVQVVCWWQTHGMNFPCVFPFQPPFLNLMGILGNLRQWPARLHGSQPLVTHPHLVHSPAGIWGGMGPLDLVDAGVPTSTMEIHVVVHFHNPHG